MKYAMTAIVIFAAEMLAKAPLDTAPAQAVDACIGEGSAGFVALARAQAIAKQLFERAQVVLTWHRYRECPWGSIIVDLLNSRSGDRPGSLGYSRPYEGVHVVVLVDRVEAAVNRLRAPALFAYVLVHEMTHILQGVDRHSSEGVMKAHWSHSDLQDIMLGRLEFDKNDVHLIRLGIAARNLRFSTTQLAQAR
jgi:hypothetical protein